MYFCGTEAEWNAIEITEWRNAPLLNATIHFLGEAVETKLTGASLQFGQTLTMNYYATLNPVHTAAQIRFTYIKPEADVIVLNLSEILLPAESLTTNSMVRTMCLRNWTPLSVGFPFRPPPH